MPARQGSLRGFKADLFDWARDYEAAIDALPARPRRARRCTCWATAWARSCRACCTTSDKVSGLVSVAAGSGYWRENAPQLKRIVLYFWYVLVPLATALYGYFPGSAVCARSATCRAA